MRPQQRPRKPALLKEWGSKWHKAHLAKGKGGVDWPDVPKTWLDNHPEDDLTADERQRVADKDHAEDRPAGQATKPKATLYTILIRALRPMTQGHCAFCDSYPVQGVTKETIEHFYCNAIFRHRAFAWGNHFYACTTCQDEKKQRWHRDLIKPDSSDYLQKGFIHYFDCERDGRIVPRHPIGSREYRRASKTIALYGLNEQGRPFLRSKALSDWQRKGASIADIHSEPYRDFISYPQAL